MSTCDQSRLWSLQGHTYGNFWVPSMPRESRGQLESVNLASLPNHKDRFLLEPKQEKKKTFLLSALLSTYLTSLPCLEFTAWRETNIHMFYHLPPPAPSTSHNAADFFFLFLVGWGHSLTYFPPLWGCICSSIFPEVKIINGNQVK